MQITIDKIISPGRSIAKPEGKIIFTDDGLPGETVEVEIVKEKKNYIEAKTLKVLSPSVHRIQPRCAHHMICSPYQHIDYPLQVEIKKAQIEEIFGHQLKIEPGALAFRASENIWRYRNKIQLR
ncbi:MAG: TRAM domain-containing protein, partial [Candidatus Omnitrophota bacterium]